MSKRHWVEVVLDRFPPWPSERQWVTMSLFALIAGELAMANNNPRLWEVEVFKVIIQATVLTGFLNMCLAFHFAANKSDEVKTQNTTKVLDTMKAQADAFASTNTVVTGEPDKKVTLQGGETATVEAVVPENEE